MKHCTERKIYLSGEEITFDCELIDLNKTGGILKYINECRFKVGNLVLDAGTITYGFFWPKRDYTLYKWLNKDGVLLANYFNIADWVNLSEKEFVWRDLIVDILVLPGGEVEILDEVELPTAADTWLKIYIEATKQMVLRKYPAIIEETNHLLKQYPLANLFQVGNVSREEHGFD